jgi:hypothetical protein
MPAVATRADAIRLEVAGVTSQMLHAVGAAEGVVVEFASGRNGVGTGYLATGPAGTTLAWKAPGSSTYGTYVDVSAGGSFLLEDGADADKCVRVTVTASRLPTSASESRVLLGDRYNNDVASDDITSGQATAGVVETYTLSAQNDSFEGVPFCHVWVDAAISGLEVSPDGVTWSTPTDEAASIEIGPIAAGAAATLHVRLTISPGATYDPDILTHLHLAYESWSG